MILSKSRKFLFLRVPKTASTSLQHQILESIPIDEIDANTGVHIYEKENFTTKQIIDAKFNLPAISPDLFTNAHPNILTLIKNKLITFDELKDLNVYGVMRDPVDRIISCAQHVFKNKTFDPPLTNALAVSSMFILFEKNDPMIKNYEDFLKPQIHWIRFNGRKINKIFKYQDISKLLFEITGESKLKYTHRSNIRRFKQIALPQELIQEIRKKYPEDFALWESLP